MPSPTRLSAETLAAELAKLPLLSAATGCPRPDCDRTRHRLRTEHGRDRDRTLDTVRLGEYPAGVPAPANTGTIGSSACRSGADSSAQPTQPHIGKISGAAWSDQIVSLPLAKAVNTRVAIIDRAPTALGGLDLPAWARVLSPSAIYGPITTNSGSPLTTLANKWIIVFNLVEMVEFVRAGQVLCVVPLNELHIGSPKQATIRGGSAWIAARPLASAAPADAFAGIAIESGELISDEALPFGGTTVNVPTTATLQLILAPAPMPASPASASLQSSPHPRKST